MTFVRVCFACLLWLGLGFSLGWYYTITYFGRTGAPMPIPEGCGALLLYYFSVMNASSEVQAAHWLAVFPAAGMLWTTALWTLAPAFGGQRPEYARFVAWMSGTCVPLIVPGFLIAFWVGNTDFGWSWEHMTDAAFRRAKLPSWWWLTPIYITLGLVALGGQMATYRRVMSPRGWKGAAHFAASAAVLFAACTVLGAVLGVPLRLGAE